MKALPWIVAALGLGAAAYLFLKPSTSQPVSQDRNPNGGVQTTATDGFQTLVDGFVKLVSGGMQIAQSSQKTT